MEQHTIEGIFRRDTACKSGYSKLRLVQWKYDASHTKLENDNFLGGDWRKTAWLIIIDYWITEGLLIKANHVKIAYSKGKEERGERTAMGTKMKTEMGVKKWDKKLGYGVTAM